MGGGGGVSFLFFPGAFVCAEAVEGDGRQETIYNPTRREPTLRRNGPKNSPIPRFHVVVTEMEHRDGPNGNGMGRRE